VSLYCIANLSLQTGCGTAGHMAGNIHRHRQAGNMGGHCLNSQTQAGGSAAESLWANTQSIYCVQSLSMEIWK